MRVAVRLVPMCVVAILLTAADWPLFRGNSLQDGISKEKLPEQLDELWKIKTGKQGVEGTAAIVDGVVYIGSLDQYLYALNLRTGQEKWKFKAGPFKHPVAVDKGRVYAGDLDGKFFCVRAQDGSPLWKFEAENAISAGASFAAGRILIGSDDETLYCLDENGKKAWEFKLPGGPVMATPAVGSNLTFVAGCDSKLHMIDIKTGRDEGEVDIDGQTGCTPAIRDNVLYLGTQSNELLAIDLTKKQIIWRFESETRKQPFNGSAAVTEKYVLIGNQNKRLYAIDRKTGQQVWEFVTEGRIDGSPVICGDRIYFGSADECLYVVDLNKGTQIQKITLDGPVVASPAVSNGILVIGTQTGTIYAFGKK
jgi:outer membrane protein assembly factor BamB